MRYAGFWMRFLASFIDSIIMGITSGILAAIFGFSDVLLLIGLLYYWLMTGLTGATLGKMALGLRVVMADGEGPGLATAFLREIAGKFVSGLLLGLGYLWAAFDGKKQALHDKIASTYVVFANSLGKSAITGD